MQGKEKEKCGTGGILFLRQWPLRGEIAQLFPLSLSQFPPSPFLVFGLSWWLLTVTKKQSVIKTILLCLSSFLIFLSCVYLSPSSNEEEALILPHFLPALPSVSPSQLRNASVVALGSWDLGSLILEGGVAVSQMFAILDSPVCLSETSSLPCPCTGQLCLQLLFPFG